MYFTRFISECRCVEVSEKTRRKHTKSTGAPVRPIRADLDAGILTVRVRILRPNTRISTFVPTAERDLNKQRVPVRSGVFRGAEGTI